jgi:hypothetical protein
MAVILSAYVRSTIGDFVIDFSVLSEEQHNKHRQHLYRTNKINPRNRTRIPTAFKAA